jgi:hypothetical protein
VHGTFQYTCTGEYSRQHITTGANDGSDGNE